MTSSSEGRVFIGPTILFLDSFVQHDSHVILWRAWQWTELGILTDKNGHRYDRRGNPIP